MFSSFRKEFSTQVLHDRSSGVDDVLVQFCVVKGNSNFDGALLERLFSYFIDDLKDFERLSCFAVFGLLYVSLGPIFRRIVVITFLLPTGFDENY